MLGFLNSAMSSATQRFLAFEIGKPGAKNVSSIFSMSMNIHIIIAIFVCLLGETVGLWFVQTQMTIPVERLHAAEWVFHLSLISFAVTIVSVPYNAIIIANERMSIFAWVSIVDVTLKLVIVFMLGLLSMDKLILYGVLTLCVIFIVFLTYSIYRNLYVEGAKFKRFWDQELFKTMMSYTGWNLWGNIAVVMSGQGVNVLLNLYFGPAVNAARAIALQVSVALNSFVQNLQVAINPQIIKSYAENDINYMHRLVCYGAKYNFFVLLLLVAPVLMNVDNILLFWLGSVPEHTISFLQLILINILIDCVSSPLMTAAQATGRIRLYQSIVGGILLLNIPMSYLILDLYGQPHFVVFVAICISILALIARLLIVKNLILIPLKSFLREVVGRGGIIAINVYGFSYLLDGLDLGFILDTLLTVCFTLLSILIFGLDSEEKSAIAKQIVVIRTRVLARYTQ